MNHDLGVVIPTKNCRPYLERHVLGLNQWIDMASEVIVVDSFSNDGTVEFLQESLLHKNIQFLSHPPGLYESWNFGIAQVQSKYLSIATCGDTISRRGMELLLGAIKSLDCDVIISKPRFENLEGQQLPDVCWPIDDIVLSLDLKAAARIHPLEILVFVAYHFNSAITGSCASCLFQTKTLQKYPFPTEFGVAGDGAWGIKNAAKISWGILPEKVSTFLKHPLEPSPLNRKRHSNELKWMQLLSDSVERWILEGCLSSEDISMLRFGEFHGAIRKYCETKILFDKMRRAPFPWIFNLKAWGSRSKRNETALEVSILRAEILNDIRQVVASRNCDS